NYKQIIKSKKMRQTILVTGASSGFGLLIANKLHENGFHVIGTSRNPEKHQTKVPFKLLALDIADNNSIESFGKQLFTQINQLDVLINNAGYLVTGLAEETSIERSEEHTSELQSRFDLVCRLLLEKKKK